MAIRHLPRSTPRKKFTPTEEQREIVEKMASVGMTQDTIADCLGVSKVILRKYFRQELDLAAVKANVQVARRLFEKAMSGDTVAMIFWLKTRMGWREKNIHEFQFKDAQVTDRIMTPEQWEAQFNLEDNGDKSVN